MSAGSWCTLITLGCFATLASFSYGKYPPPKYVTSAEKRSVRHVAEPVVLVTLAEQRAAAIQQAFGITAQNINNDIFGGDQWTQ